jgi:hypothetical protein
MAITISGSGIVEANIADGEITSDKLATGIDATKLADGTITNSELQYINSLSSNAQTQISGAGAQTYIGRWGIAFNSIGSGSGNWTDFTFQTCGFQPSAIIIFSTVEGDADSGGWMFYGYGARDGSTTSVWEAKGMKEGSWNSSDLMNNQDSLFIQYNGNASASRRWRLKSVSSTGFQMETYYEGSATDTCYYNWLAIG